MKQKIYKCVNNTFTSLVLDTFPGVDIETGITLLVIAGVGVLTTAALATVAEVLLSGAGKNLMYCN